MSSSDRIVPSLRAYLSDVTDANQADHRRRANGTGLSTPRTATVNTPAISVYARYVGRVGALAVALGVTGAIATTPGVAWADDATRTTDSSSPTADTPASKTATDRTTLSLPDNDPASPPDEPGIVSGSLPDHTVESSDADGVDTELDEDGSLELQDGDLAPEDDVIDGPPTDTTPVAEPPVDPPVEELPPSEPESHTPPPSSPAQPDNPGQQSAGTDNHVPLSVDPVPPVVDDTPVAFVSATLADTNPFGAANRHAATEQGALPAAAAVTPAAANPVANLIAQIPTPAQVVNGIKRFVTQCACALINGALDLLGNINGANGTSAPTSPAGTPAAWAVLGWIRRQFEYAVTAFNRTPIGQFVHQVTTAARHWIGNLGNSPWGRNISARIGAFVTECEGKTGLPDDLERVTLIAGLNEPTDFELVMHEGEPGEAPHIDRILITEKSGAIKSYDMHTGELTTLTNLAVVTANGERGLIGIEVDPNFWDSTKVGEGYQKIYVAYTNAANHDQLSSFTLVGNTLSDETKLVESTLAANDFHHGGELEFDPSGQYLYWAVGNNTSPSENSQDKTNIHGKILRINRDGSGVVGNPYYSATGNPDTNRIYALGLRNPFRFGIDPDTGAVLSGDVGEGKWEELNLITAGANYGWPNTEGPQGGGFTDPIYAYPHASGFGNGSITSVMVYDDGTPVAGQKDVLIADYSLGWIRKLTFDDQYTSLISAHTFDSGAGAVVKLTQGPEGEIYQLNIYPGALMVIRPSGGNRPPVAVIDPSATSGAGTSLTVTFDAGNSTDPDTNDAENLTYSWDFGNGATSTSATETVTFTHTGASGYTAYNVTLTVTDSGGKQSTATQRIVVGSTPPVADFEVPAGEDYKYNAGDTVSFSATGTDPQDNAGGGQLPDSAFSWKVIFHHADHTHPFVDEVIGRDLAFDIPRDFHQLSNTYYNVVLTVTDSSGLKTVVQKEIHPNLVTVTFGSNVAGTQYTIDGIPHYGPYTEQAVIGVKRTLGAVSPQTVNGQQYVFGSWAHGGGATQDIFTPETGGTYTVNYVPAPVPALVV